MFNDKKDIRLFRRVARGDNKSQIELYKKYYAYAMSIAIRFCESREEAKEVVHDSYLKLFSNFLKFEDKSSFKGWFRKIIVYTSIDYYRKYSKHNHHLDVLDINEPSEEETVISNISAEEILALADNLTPVYRMVFMLHVVEGYKHSEIAEQLNISVGASKSNLSKARGKMQKMIIENQKNSIKKHG